MTCVTSDFQLLPGTGATDGVYDTTMPICTLLSGVYTTYKIRRTIVNGVVVATEYIDNTGVSVPALPPGATVVPCSQASALLVVESVVMMRDANGDVFMRQFLSDGTIRDTTLDGETLFTPVNPVEENCPCGKDEYIAFVFDVAELADNSSYSGTITANLDTTKSWVFSANTSFDETVVVTQGGTDINVHITNNSGASNPTHQITITAKGI